MIGDYLKDKHIYIFLFGLTLTNSATEDKRDFNGRLGYAVQRQLPTTSVSVLAHRQLDGSQMQYWWLIINCRIISHLYAEVPIFINTCDQRTLVMCE